MAIGTVNVPGVSMADLAAVKKLAQDADTSASAAKSAAETAAEAAQKAAEDAQQATEGLGDDYLPLAGGTMTGALVAQSNADAGTAQVRNIIAGTADLTAGTSTLATGTIYLVYE